MADSVFHKDFNAMPWWWEGWHPSNALSQDPPRKTEVLVVGAGYGGLSTALELAVLQRRDSCGVIAAIFEALQRINQVFGDRTASENSDDAAHAGSNLHKGKRCKPS